MNFDTCDHPLKIWESIGTLTPKVGADFEVWGFITQLSCTLGSMKCDFQVHSWLAPSQGLALVMSPTLGL
jgi:hypothetical protein